jgi:hypothetical protein
MAPNVISGNQTGILVNGPATAQHSIEGNTIGLDAAGLGGIGGEFGIRLFDAGSVDVHANLIAKQGIAGLHVVGASNDGKVRGNRFGSDGTGFNPQPNNVAILVVGSASSVTSFDIGTGDPLDSNRIASSMNDGVSLVSGATAPTGVRIRGNTILGNGGLGIDLANDGVTDNDPDDADGGPNERVNFPVLDHAYVITGLVTIGGHYDGLASTALTIDFYATAGDASLHGEGDFYIGSGDIMTDATGHADFELSFPQNIAIGAKVSATATNASTGTSEFAENVTTVVSPTTTSTTSSTTTSTTTATTAAPTTTVAATTTTSSTVTVPVTTTTTTTIPCATIDVAGLLCLIDALPPASCTAALPTPVTKLITAARKIAERAGTAPEARARKLLKKAAGKLTRAAKVVGRLTERGKIPGECGDDLGAALATAADRARAVAG